MRRRGSESRPHRAEKKKTRCAAACGLQLLGCADQPPPKFWPSGSEHAREKEGGVEMPVLLMHSWTSTAVLQLILLACRWALSLQEHHRQRVQNVQVTRSGPQCSERSGTARSTVCKLDHFTTASHLIKLVYHCKSSNQTSTRIAGAKGPVGAVGPAGCYMKGW